MSKGKMGRNPAKVVIIGGGDMGCLTALDLAEYRFSDGSPRFEATIIEAREHLLAGTSALGNRMHCLGTEYGPNENSASTCIIGALHWMLDFPKEMFRRENMCLAVAQETVEATNGAMTITTEQRFVEEISVPTLLREFNRIADKRHWGEIERQDIFRNLYGVEDARQFCKPLNVGYARELFRGEKYQPVDGAIEIPEFGFDIIGGNALIEYYVRNSGASIHTHCSVMDIQEQDPGSKYKFKVVTTESDIDADIVVVAANEWIPSLTAKFDPGQESLVYYRTALYLRPAVDDPSLFVNRITKLGKYGGMFVMGSAANPDEDPYGVGFALTGKATYRLGEKILTAKDPKPCPIPELNDKTRQRWMEEFFDDLCARYAILRDNTMLMDIGFGYVFNFDPDRRIEVRPLGGIREVTSGLVVAPLSKKTYRQGPRMVAYLVKERAKDPDADIPFPADHLDLLPQREGPRIAPPLEDQIMGRIQTLIQTQTGQASLNLPSGPKSRVRNNLTLGL